MDGKTLEGKVLANQDRFAKFANVLCYTVHFMSFMQLGNLMQLTNV